MHTVKVNDISHSYKDREALIHLTFQCYPNSMTAILGPNGSGKSTLFRILSSLVRPQTGSVSVLGLNIANDRKAIRRNLGIVFQSPSLDGKLSVKENLIHHGHFYGYCGHSLHEKIQQLTRRFEIEDRTNDLVHRLSGGLQRRVELVKSLLHDPKILILDEPTTGLDPVAREEFWRILREIKTERELTVLYTTHFMEEATIADRVLILNNGTIIADDTPQSLVSKIPGEVITIIADDLEALETYIRRNFDVKIENSVDHLRIESNNCTAILSNILSANQSEIESISINRATLQDVFYKLTGAKWNTING